MATPRRTGIRHDAPLVVGAVEADLRSALAAMRDRLAYELDHVQHERGCECECGPTGADPRAVALVVQRLAEVVTQLDSLPPAEGVSRVDELAGKRRARRSAARAADA